MPTIRFDAKLVKIGSWTLLTLPEPASAALPSRGMVIVEGSINGVHFQAPLEPDGNKGHWLRVDGDLLKAIVVKPADKVTLEIEPSKEWPDPDIPADLKEALSGDTQANNTWMDITSKARWDWVRWINGTKHSETRQRRIDVACSKLNAGNRRPCCFSNSQCTDQSVSKNGILLEPNQAPS